MHITYTHITEERTDWIGTVRRGSSLCFTSTHPFQSVVGTL